VGCRIAVEDGISRFFLVRIKLHLDALSDAGVFWMLMMASIIVRL